MGHPWNFECWNVLNLLWTVALWLGSLSKGSGCAPRSGCSAVCRPHSTPERVPKPHRRERAQQAPTGRARGQSIPGLGKRPVYPSMGQGASLSQHSCTHTLVTVASMWHSAAEGGPSHSPGRQLGRRGPGAGGHGACSAHTLTEAPLTIQKTCLDRSGVVPSTLLSKLV